MKQTIIITLVTTFLFTIFAASMIFIVIKVANISIDETYDSASLYEYQILSNKDAAVIKYVEKDNREIKRIVIPEVVEIEEKIYNIISIEEAAFFNAIFLTHITIPDSVINIDDRAFAGCGNLSNINITDKIINIGASAFASCKKLTTFYIPKNVTTLESSVFYGCTSLNEIVVNEENLHLKVIDGVLYNYDITNLIVATKNVINVYIPNSVLIIGDTAFNSCSYLQNVTIPNGVTSIGSHTFRDCLSITSVIIPASVTKIGTNAFNGCNSLTNIYVDSNNNIYSSIDGNLYSKDETTFILPAYGKKSVSIAANTAIIESYAFHDNNFVENVNISSSVLFIKSYAFRTCYSLESIIIPSTVFQISENAFYNCRATSIYTPLDSEPFTWHPDWSVNIFEVVWGYTENI